MADNHFKVHKGLTIAPQSSEPANPTNGDIYYDSTLNQFRKYENGAWTSLGSGNGSGGINYIDNGDAEANADGWATYADAAGTSPVDGIGGSPNVTFTRSTSSPLRSQASFLFTKDAVNRQGQGFSYDFTIDDADLAKVMQISMDYKVASGTYADGDVKIYIYDVTNGVIIEPAGHSLLNVLDTGKVPASFQTNINSNNYRLIFHVSSTSASAFTLKFDNISVGPVVKSQGFAGTDWKPYTPTGSWTTNVNYTGQWRRIGDSIEGLVTLEIVGGIAAGDLTFSAAQLFNGIGGLSIDINKLTSYGSSNDTISIGVGQYEDSGALNRGGCTVWYQRSFGGIKIAGPSFSDFNGGANTPIAFAAGDSISFTFKLPIVGWSSNVEVSSDTDTRVVSMSYKSVSSTTITASTPLAFITKRHDTHGAWSTNKFIVPVAGKYRVSFSGFYAASGISDLGVFLNGVEYAGFMANINTSRNSGSVTVDCKANDEITIVPNGSGTITDATNVYLSIERLSGPSQIAASESVNARYQATSGQVFGVGTSTVLFPTKIYDSHYSFSSNTTYSAPMSGKYSVKVKVTTNTISSVSTNVLNILVNGVVVSSCNYADSYATAGGFTFQCIDDIQLVAGDLVTITFTNGFGGSVTAVTTIGQNIFSISRIGN